MDLNQDMVAMEVAFLLAKLKVTQDVERLVDTITALILDKENENG